jgi:putative SOS response-associated peptidase YedK
MFLAVIQATAANDLLANAIWTQFGTKTPNELCAPIHDRMLLILAPETWPVWLGEEAAEPAQLKALLRPYPAEGMTAWRVGKAVGTVKNNDPSLIEAVA